MKLKTAELTGLPLRYAAALAEGGTGLWHDTVSTWFINIGLEDRPLKKGWALSYCPDLDWSQGGPILEREKISVTYDRDWKYDPNDPEDNGDRWLATLPLMGLDEGYSFYGPTMLVAAMRCFVASKLGDEVEIPDELLEKA